MTPVMQTVIDAEKGDCMRASIASLLDKKLEEVPDIQSYARDEWQGVLFSWLHNQGYQMMGCQDNEEDMLDPHYGIGVDGYLLVAGSSPRGFKRGHMVVYKDGKLAHDPHPSGEGIGEFWEFWMIERQENGEGE